MEVQDTEEGTRPIQNERPDSISMKTVKAHPYSANPVIPPQQGQNGSLDCNPNLKPNPDPEPSVVSLKSDWSLYQPPYFAKSVILHRPGQNGSLDLPEPSFVSLKSDGSLYQPPYFKNTDIHPQPGTQGNELTGCQLRTIFKDLENNIINLIKNQLKKYMKLLSPDDQEPITEPEVKDEDDQSSVREGTLKITVNVLKKMNQTDLANTLQTKLQLEYQQKHKSSMINKSLWIHEGISQSGSSVLLNEIYTELYITEGWGGEISDEHEMRQIETTSSRPVTEERPIKCNEIFKDKSVRTVLTKGFAGIGKTVSVQKFILDWAEGKANHDVMFMFPLPFRELNLMKGKNLSLMNLLRCFFPELKEFEVLRCDLYKVVFIFDGLDECRLPLNFQSNEIVYDVTESAPVDVLLTNLIKGNLFPSAFLWMTSRPGAASQIPPECVDLLTEVQGFSDFHKDEYFRKKISDQELADKIITHMKSSRNLYIMCHLPVFCWISASVLERMLEEAKGGEIPKTLTQMFTHFLIYQVKHKDQKYHGKYHLDPEQTRESILALGNLAFQQLDKGNLIFYEEDLRECGIDLRDASVYSGVCTQIFREEFGLHLGKVFSFVHRSVQEFLAALYVFLCFTLEGKDLMVNTSTGKFNLFPKPMSEFLKNAVGRALQSKNGHLDLFLRFLMGLSLESNQTLLQGFMPQTGITSHRKEEIVKYIKKKIGENFSSDKFINLFHCLNELKDQSVVNEVQSYLNQKRKYNIREAKLSSFQWSALVFLLLNSEEDLAEFCLVSYDPSEECLLRLMKVVKASRKAELSHCNLTARSCAALSVVLSSNSSNLTELHLSNNKLQDLGVEQLCEGLRSQHNKLSTLWLSNCHLTEKSCVFLSAALASKHSCLKELDLSGNFKIQDSGVKLLSVGLLNPQCKLELLRLRDCKLTAKSCAALSPVLQRSGLRELELRQNAVQDAGALLLSAALSNPNCKLETLNLVFCSIGEDGFVALASALLSNPLSQLTELNLLDNNPGEMGLKTLSDLLKDPRCKLKTIEGAT